jgi:hypothetical protein
MSITFPYTPEPGLIIPIPSAVSANVAFMPAHKTTVTVRSDHQVVVRLPDDFPAGEAEVVITPRPTAPSPREAVAEFDRFLAGLPPAPVVSLESLDRGSLNR